MNKRTYVAPWFKSVALYCSAQTAVTISGDDDDDSDKTRPLEWDEEEDEPGNVLGIIHKYWTD